MSDVDAFIEFYEDDTVGAAQTGGTDTIELYVQGEATVKDVAQVDFIEVNDGRGPKGDPGPSSPGTPGKSAYQLFVDAGFTGTEAEWRASLAGDDGGPGSSAYQIAQANGFVGTEAAWLASLKGDPGLSAYQVAVAGGYGGSSAAWLASLQGAPGASAYQVAVAGGYGGSQAAWLASLQGAAGASAYDVAVANGFVGNQAAWLASLVGAQGPAVDVTTLGYGEQMPSPPNWYVYSQQILTTSASAPANNRPTFFPIFLLAGVYDMMSCSVTVAQVGGDSAFYGGLYAREPVSGYFPDVNAGPRLGAAFASMNAGSSAATKYATPAGGATYTVVKPGWFWACTLLVINSAPTTNFTVLSNANQTWYFPDVGFTNQGSNRGRFMTGTHTVLPTGQTTLTNTTFGQVGSGNTPVIGFRKVS